MCIACEEKNFDFLCPDCQAALVKVIQRQRRCTSVNETKKLVRMADGSRKWFTNEEAEPLLQMKRAERK